MALSSNILAGLGAQQRPENFGETMNPQQERSEALQMQDIRECEEAEQAESEARAQAFIEAWLRGEIE